MPDANENSLKSSDPGVDPSFVSSLLVQVRELQLRDIRSLSGSSAHIQRLLTADTRRLGAALREVRFAGVLVPGGTHGFDRLAALHLDFGIPSADMRFKSAT
jgi:hypothetical protein